MSRAAAGRSLGVGRVVGVGRGGTGEKGRRWQVATTVGIGKGEEAEGQEEGSVER